MLTTIKGCDKTTPAQLMGGISANKPIIHLVTGPMMPGSHKGTRIGACTDCRNNWASFRAGTIDVEDISAVNDELAPTVRIIHHKVYQKLICLRQGLAASWEQLAPWLASLLPWE